MLLSELFTKIESNIFQEQEGEKIKTNSLLKNLIITMFGRKDFFHFAKTPFKKLMLQNGTELTLDMSFVIRPKDDFLDIDLSTLTDDELLSAVTINLPPNESAGAGAFNTSFKSKKQCKYDYKNDAFTISETVNTKNIRQSIPEPNIDKSKIVELSEDKKAFIRRYMGKPKKETGKGVYFLKNADGEQLSILPYVDGVDFFDFLASDQLMLIDGMDLRLRKIALDLALNLAQFHTLEYIHRDIKPENIVVKNDDSTCFIDLDFITKIDEIITAKKGTLEYHPAFATEIFKKDQKPTVYQDIYGNMICMLLMFDPEFNSFQDVYAENLKQGNNAEKAVTDYFISMLKREPGSYLSNIFLPFFLYPEKVTAPDLLNQFLYIDHELAQHAINTVTKNDPAGKERLELYIQGYNKVGNGVFTQEKKRFITYLGTLLIQNKSFEETDFANHNFQLITQDTAKQEINNLYDALKAPKKPKALLPQSTVFKIITYLTSDNYNLSAQIFNHYKKCYDDCTSRKQIQPMYRTFITTLLTVFESKMNDNRYDHEHFLYYLTEVENYYLMQRQTADATRKPTVIQPLSQDVEKNSFFLGSKKRSKSADGNLRPSKKMKLFEELDNNIPPQENSKPNKATHHVHEYHGMRGITL